LFDGINDRKVLMKIETTIKSDYPGKGWPQYGKPVRTDYGHEVEVHASSIAFTPHCWLRIYDPGNYAMQPGYSDEGCDVSAHLTVPQVRAIRDRLDAFLQAVRTKEFNP
jgi:hypothetical protein